MTKSFLSKQLSITIAAMVLAAMVVTGCSGFKPTENRNNREEGPEKGLLTGSSGEFVIYQSKPDPQQTQQNGEQPEKTE